MSEKAAPMRDSAAPGIRLDAILRRHAARRPDALALLDPPDRAALTGHAPRRLTYGEAERAVESMAAKLRALDLPPRSAVALQLPNTVEAVVALLAVMRAGLVAAPLPLLWRRAEGAAAIGRIGARALVACGRVGRTDYGAVALQVAADALSIRYVCGFGDAPDGVVPLDDIFAASPAPAAGIADGEATSTEEAPLALVTFDTATGAPAMRGHAALLVGGLTVVLEAALPRHATLLGTVLPASFAGLATTVVPWLMTGGTLALHHPFDATAFAEQMAGGIDAAIVPAPLLAELEGGMHGNARLVALWRDLPPWPHSRMAGLGGRVVDVLAFGETGVVAARRQTDGTPGRLAAGPRRAPHDAADAPAVMRLARTPAGTLAIGGPMLPLPLPQEGADPGTDRAAAPNGEGDTGYPCCIDPHDGALRVIGPPPGTVQIGGYCFVLSALQETVARIAGDGVLAALPDPLAGQKLAGAAADPAAMRHALAALGANPLVANAFRDPRRAHADAPAG